MVAVAEPVGVLEGVRVGVRVRVLVGVNVAEAEPVGVPVLVDVPVNVGVLVLVAVGVDVLVDVYVAVTAPGHTANGLDAFWGSDGSSRLKSAALFCVSVHPLAFRTYPRFANVVNGVNTLPSL